MRLVPVLLAIAALAGCGGGEEGGKRLVVVGDSLAVGTRDLLAAELEGWDVRTEAVEGWPLAVGLDALERTEVPEGAVLAFSLFTNDLPRRLPELEAAVRRTARMRCSVWATIAHPAHDFGGVNARLRALDRELARVVVVPWAETVAERPELLKRDRVHGTEEGYRVRAALYADAARSCTT